MKALLALDATSLAEGGPGCLDRAFIAEHTPASTRCSPTLRRPRGTTSRKHPACRARRSKRSAPSTRKPSASSSATAWASPSTATAPSNVQQIANLLLLRGNIGRPGAGICPLRGHSQRAGRPHRRHHRDPDRRAARWARPYVRFRAAAAQGPQRGRGGRRRSADGRSKALICLGGNLAVAMSDPQATFAAMRKLDLAVHIATKLNRSHLLVAQADVHPALPRPHRARCAGRRRASRHGRGLDVDGSRLARRAEAGLARPALGARDRRRPRLGDAAGHEGTVART